MSLFFLQKQPSRDVLRKRCSKVVGQLYWKHTLTWMLSSKFVAYFQNTFSLTKPLGGGLFLFLESKTQCNMNWLNAPSRNSHRSCSIEKSFPKNFSKFTEKHLWIFTKFFRTPPVTAFVHLSNYFYSWECSLLFCLLSWKIVEIYWIWIIWCFVCCNY